MVINFPLTKKLIQMFMAWNDWSRVPGSLTSLNASLSAMKARLNELDNDTCVAWVDPTQPDDEPSLLPPECFGELSFLRMEIKQIYLRIVYLLRRQWKYLSLVSASCLLQGNDVCVSAVMRSQLNLDQRISGMLSSLPIGLHDIHLLNNLKTQACNGTFPCLSELIDPVLLTTRVENIRAALRTMLRLLEPSLEHSSLFLSAVLKNASAPLFYCGFYHTYQTIRECPTLTKQLYRFRDDFALAEGWKFVTPSVLLSLQQRSRNCLWDCGLYIQAEFMAAVSLTEMAAVRVAIVQHVRILCDSGFFFFYSFFFIVVTSAR